jgi:hypothetical protein
MVGCLLVAACSGGKDSRGSTEDGSAVGTTVGLEDLGLADPTDLTDVVARTTEVGSVHFEAEYTWEQAQGTSASHQSARVDFTRSVTSMEEGRDPGFEGLVRIGDRSWLAIDPNELGLDVPASVRWLEAPTAVVVSRGIDWVSPAAIWAPLYFLDGAEAVRRQSDGSYAFHVDVRRVPNALTDDQRVAWVSMMQNLRGPASVTSATGTLRVDEEGRAVELQVVVVVDWGATLTMSITLADFGEPVVVVEPRADEVVTLDDHPELLASIGRSLKAA